MNKEQRVAKEIYDLVGGKENVRAVEHCATRLRLSLKDESIAKNNEQAIDEIDGVKGQFYSVGQFQIILGTGFVNQVHDEFLKLGVEKGDIKEEVYQDLNTFQKISRILGDVFIPIIPAIVAAGMFMGFANTLKFMGILDPSGNLAIFISILTDTAFAFLPALICWSAMKKFGGNPVLGIVLGLMLVSPSLPNAWSTAGGLGDAEPLMFNLGFFSVAVTGMQGQVLTPLFLGWFGAKLEKFFRKFVPKAVDLIVVPAFVLIISLVVGLFIAGPILYNVEHFVTTLVYSSMDLPFGIGQAIFAFFNPLIVMTGLHHALGAIDVTMISEYGSTPLNVASSASNIALAGAATGAAIKLREGKMKSLGYSSAITACFGITEPALFGVIVRIPKLLLSAMIGGACGGLIGGAFKVYAVGTGVTGIPGILLYIGTGKELLFIVAMLVSFGVACILAMKICKYDE